MRIEEGKQLSTLTTLGIGGPARYFSIVESLGELREIFAFCRQNNLPIFPLGKGSNTLFDDKGFNGMVILNKLHFCKAQEKTWYVSSGYSFSLLGVQTSRQGWKGLEFASGIPGSVGGAVYMNAGANGQQTFDSLVSVDFMDLEGNLKTYSKEELTWGYRFSKFQQMSGLITAATFELTPDTQARNLQVNMVKYRKETQPYGDLSAGCVFRNPSQSSAGALIEKSGLKGFSIGGAAISTTHANFIVNTGQATASDFLTLASYVQKTVKEKTGIDLEMEVRVVPFQS